MDISEYSKNNSRVFGLGARELRSTCFRLSAFSFPEIPITEANF
jgi:hypothetical protein